MKFEPNYKRPFSQFVKKQHKPFQAVIEDQVLLICEDPAMGEEKAGDLAGIRVHKFAYQKQVYLMAYAVVEGASIVDGDEDSLAEQFRPQFILIDFYQTGTHENFYAVLKAYLKTDGWHK